MKALLSEWTVTINVYKEKENVLEERELTVDVDNQSHQKSYVYDTMFTRILTLTSGVILAISLIGCSSVDHSKPEVVAPGPMSIDDMALADDMVGRWKWSAPNFGDEVQVPLKARYSLKFGGSMASSGDGTWIDDGDQLHLAQWSTVNVEERRVSITYRGWFNKSQRKTYLYTVSGTISEDGIFITGTYRYQSLAGDAPIDVTGDFSGMRSFDG